MGNDEGEDNLTAKLDKLTDIVTQLAALQQNVQQTSSSQASRFSFDSYKSNSSESIEEYFDRFLLQLNLCNIPETNWASHLRVHMGPDLNSTLSNLSYPTPVHQLDFQTIKTKLIDHFVKSRNKYSEAINFRKIVQKTDESVVSFVSRLKAGARYCQFGDFLDYSLIVQFIHGVIRDDIRDEIVGRKPDKFDETIKIAIEMEATREAATVLKHNPVETQHKFVHESRPKLKKQPNQRNRSQSRSRQMSQGKKCNHTSPKSCNSCGGSHWRQSCKFRSYQCNLCKRIGHLAKVCRQKVPDKKGSQNVNEIVSSSDIESQSEFLQVSVNSINSSTPRAIINVLINDKPVAMELDTGGACSIVSFDTLNKILPNAKILPSTRKFSSYTKTKFNSLGYVQVDVTFHNRTKLLNLYVIDFSADSIFGREWIIHFADLLNFNDFFKVNKLDVQKPISNSNLQTDLANLLNNYESLFSDSAGTLVGPPVHLHLKANSTPVFARARLMPISLRDRYAQEIDRKLQSGLYTKVTHSEWASPTHVVIKGEKLRITGDYKATLNPQLIIDEHPIPRIEDMFNKLKNAKFFCKLDVTDAFMSLPCDESSCEIMTLNTPTHGLIRPTRAQYGVASVPAIWQRRLEEVLRGLKGAINFFDDILVFAESAEKLFCVLKEVLDKLVQSGLKLKHSKCEFFLESIEFLGHRIDGSGLHKLDKHVSTIVNAPKPKTPDELRSFLGKVTYYHSFIPNLSTVTFPLREMLNSNNFKWTNEGLEAFKNLKSTLTSDQVLVPFNPELPVILATDASPVGLGAVLSHIFPDGSERPIAYGSKSLNSAEKNYPQIDKEALAIVWGVKKFFQYLYGRKFTIYTDNKPVSHIFAPDAMLPKFTLSRCSNYASYLSNFTYDIKHKTSKENINADYLSRIHISETLLEPDDFDNFVQQQILQLPVTSEDIASETKKDPLLSPLLTAIQQGQNLATLGFKGRELDYSQSCNCLMLGHRVVIPTKLRQRLLEELHMAHIGVTKMKGLARSIIYWPNIDSDIEQITKNCEACLKNSIMPAKYNTHHWEYPSEPWSRIHIDYAGPIHGKYLLIIVDSYSKWTQVHITNKITSEETCKLLQNTFSLYGVPDTVVSDNGPQFTSNTFKDFLKMQGVRFHKRIAPYHPATNGQAERYVQTIKRALMSMGTSASNLREDINEFLQQYHKAPHSTTGQPPSLLFLGRIIRTRIDTVRPDLRLNIKNKDSVSSKSSIPRSFNVGDPVMFRSYNSSTSWLRGIVVKKFGDLHYEVEHEGIHHKRHIDQLSQCANTSNNPKKRVHFAEPPRKIKYYNKIHPTLPSSSPLISSSSPSASQSTPINQPNLPSINLPSTKPSVSCQQSNLPPSELTNNLSNPNSTGNDINTQLRRSTRQKKPRRPFSPT